LSHWAILDTNIYIGHWERALYTDELDAIRRGFLVRHSSVVLSELRRGARTPSARKLVAELKRTATAEWEPLPDDWWDAGRIVQKIGDTQTWEIAKRREFQNAALIALTARRHGATVVTANGGDFALLGKELRIDLVIV